MDAMDWPSKVHDYDQFVNLMNTPRVVVDNAVCATSTVVQVQSAHGSHRVLLDAVAALADLDVVVRKGYVSHDGRWFMDVFRVTDRKGRKLGNPAGALAAIEAAVAGAGAGASCAASSGGGGGALTAFELTGADRPGLLSEVFAVLAEMSYNTVEAKMWTHRGRVAAVILARYDGGAGGGTPPAQSVERKLRQVLRGVAVAAAEPANADLRLHQIMARDRGLAWSPPEEYSSRAAVAVQDWRERGYSVVTVQCRDRAKLLFDVVCALTDMGYVVFHGMVDTDGDLARQEFHIRNSEGNPITSEPERQRVIQFIQAAIERRAPEGLRLELSTSDRTGLLADVTRIFRENGLNITHADITTRGGTAMNVFHVTDVGGRALDARAVDVVIESVGEDSLRVGDDACAPPRPASPGGDGGERAGSAGLLHLGNLVKKNLFNLGLIKSCS